MSLKSFMHGASLLAIFAPPDRHPAIVDAQHRYNWRVYGALVALATIVMGEAVLSFGLFPKLYRGFAAADDVRQLRTLNVQTALVDTNERWCKSTGDAKSLYLRSLIDLKTQYVELTQRELPLPQCNEL